MPDTQSRRCPFHSTSIYNLQITQFTQNLLGKHKFEIMKCLMCSDTDDFSHGAVLGETEGNESCFLYPCAWYCLVVYDWQYKARSNLPCEGCTITLAADIATFHKYMTVSLLPKGISQLQKCFVFFSRRWDYLLAISNEDPISTVVPSLE